MISSLVRASSVSLGLHNLAIFKTSLISLLPAFQTEEAICITVLQGNLLTILVDMSLGGRPIPPILTLVDGSNPPGS